MSVINKKTNHSSSKHNDTEEEANYRIYSIISYFIVLIVIGLPIWWYTTRVYRASLPLSKMQEILVKNNTDRDAGTPLSLEYDLLISFIHPDPFNPEILLSGKDIENNLQPYLDKISPIAEFVVKSQWLYLLSLGVTPKKYDNYLALTENQLPHIITPIESRLWSHVSPRPTINLLLYFQPCNNLPMYIYDNKNQRVQSNAFLSSRWGGFYIMNPEKVSCESGKFKPDLHSIVSIFITQLQEIFKIDNILNSDDIHELKTRKAGEMLDSTYRTLRSLEELLSEIKSIVISEDVGKKINMAMEKADLARELLYKGNTDKALELAKIAFKNSEEAFSDPSLLALLYFPEDQKYAVYIPLFLPIMIPVIMSLPNLKKWFISKKEKQE